MHKHSQDKRRKNRKQAINILNEANIPYKSKNLGAHLIIQGQDSIIDFWPGTGKFIFRDSLKKGRGINNLLRYC